MVVEMEEIATMLLMEGACLELVLVDILVMVQMGYMLTHLD